MKWKCLSFEELTTTQLYQLLQLRSEVFVVEQDCVYQDIDGLDQQALHVMGYKNQEMLAYARIFKPGIYFKEASIGRVIVKENSRAQDIGHLLMQKCIYFVQQNFETTSIRISAQQYLIKFYEYQGFASVGEGYLEDGIPHINMVKEEE
ncbi:GNAT family N-acetyltransferase [Psychroflexus maritimus]|uniref:GNAT family N-acetyltransferase n=1 Tax=Psychroflexus maritimus TaxID=2714865 RepID=A0A967DY49_9FLAO|nr:GNAT family N-acetyltransferase [Psychroflexus maritimus]NGZ89435.1 GNAT family N-acetyltransferase [Psychroflexus maritimus]